MTMERHEQKTLFPCVEESRLLCSPLKDGVALQTYITELRRAKEKAEETSLMKDKFLSMIAHDLRAPLASIIGLLKLVERDSVQPLHVKHKGTVGRAIGASAELLGMLDELLNIGRLKTGAIKLKSVFFSGYSIASLVVDGLKLVADEKNVLLVNDVPKENRLYGDKSLYREVLHNLVSNAIKFSHSGGTVRVFVPPGQRSMVAVEDTGVGVPLETLSKILGGGDVITTRGTADEHGTGLGIKFSRDIMAMHSGTLSAHSEVGKGSVFMATLPYLRPKVHLVDDDPNVHEIAAAHLDEIDVDILFSTNVAEALHSIGREQPNIILTDITMPIMSGFDLLDRVRKHRTWKDLPVIMITSSNDMHVRELAFQSGANDFITKPLIREDLIPRIRRFMC
jgi:K+-sensing histidine kinase KdpD